MVPNWCQILILGVLVGDPKHLPDVDLDRFASHVSRGRHCTWWDKDDVPTEFRKWTAYPTNAAFRGASLVGSSTSQNPPTLGGVGVPAGTPVFLLRTVRYDEKLGELHLNADDRLFFRAQNGETIQVTRKDHPEHFAALSDDTGLVPAIREGMLPPTEEGPASEFSRGVSFST